MTEEKFRPRNFFLIILIIFVILNFCWYYLNENFQAVKLELDPLDDYIKLHNLIRKKNSYKIVTCHDIRPGYANKIYNVLSGLMIAILSNSSFSIVWPELQQFVEPPLNDVFKEPKLIKPIKIATPNSYSWHYKKQVYGLLEQKIPNGSHLIFQTNKAYFFYLVANPYFYSTLLRYKLVSRETIEHAEKILRQKSNNVEPFLSIGFEAGHRIMQKFWLLTPNFTKIVENFYEQNLKGSFVIGIQIRTQFLKKNDSDLGSFMSCALQIENMLQRNVTVKWFVTSDSENAVRKLRKFYPTKVVIGLGKMGHIRFKKEAYFRTVMDSELLAKSDEIIISGGSTYGFVSAVRKGSLPFYIDGVDFNFPCRRMNFSHLPRSKSGAAIF